MDEILLKCRAADALSDTGADAERIGEILGVKKSSVYNMIKVWSLYNQYNPTLRNWQYTQLVQLLPISDRLPDFFARMDIDVWSPVSARELKTRVAEYRELKKEQGRSFNLTRDDDYIKLDGSYFPLDANDKKMIKEWLESGDNKCLK